jgi:hypothetical protein
MSTKTFVFLMALFFALIVLVGCKRDNGNGKVEPNPIITIKISEGQPIYKPHHKFNFIVYCGMPNEGSFSLAYSAQWAVNYYYPKDSKQVYFRGDIYEVISVNPNEISLRHASQ